MMRRVCNRHTVVDGCTVSGADPEKLFTGSNVKAKEATVTSLGAVEKW